MHSDTFFFTGGHDNELGALSLPVVSLEWFGDTVV